MSRGYFVDDAAGFHVDSPRGRIVRARVGRRYQAEVEQKKAEIAQKDADLASLTAAYDALQAQMREVHRGDACAAPAPGGELAQSREPTTEGPSAQTDSTDKAQEKLARLQESLASREQPPVRVQFVASIEDKQTTAKARAGVLGTETP